MSVAEQLLLLALDPEKGRPGLGKKDALEPGLCGALVSELALRNAVEASEGRAVVLGGGSGRTRPAARGGPRLARRGGERCCCPRIACLVALLRACQLLGTVTDGLAERRRASARAKAAMDDPAARAVKAIFDEVHAVAAAAVVAISGG